MYLYYDIETVPDTKLPKDMEDTLMEGVKPAANARDKEASILEKREKLRDEFGLLPLTNQVVAIVAVMVSEKDGTLNTFASCKTDEKKLLTEFQKWTSDMARKYAESVIPVTFNGKSFDHHVLFIKFAQHSIEPPPFGFLFGKYDSNHLDLRMLLVNFDQYGRGNLGLWARRFGYPEMLKQDHKGSDIKLLFETKQYDTILQKCKEDVDMLLFIHMKLKAYI